MSVYQQAVCDNCGVTIYLVGLGSRPWSLDPSDGGPAGVTCPNDFTGHHPRI